MEAAGATIIERTGQNAVMGVPGIKKILEHQRINARVARWMKKGLAKVHIPVDSPAANFPICALAKRNRMKVVHLVAPQVWAWGSWRVRKLRRLTDQVLCILPFEEDWFVGRGVKATFIGHPLFDHPLDMTAINARAQAIGAGSPRLALMPGSRPSEMLKCFPILLDAYRRLRADFPQTAGVVATTRPEAATMLRQIASDQGGWPQDLRMVIADTDAAIAWCDFALVVSGTVTLQIARQHKPMVAVYRPNKLMYFALIKWLVTTRLFTLPNLIAGRQIVPELIPHFGDGEALAVEVIKLLRRNRYADDQRENLAAIGARFAGKHAASAAADAIERVGGLTPSFSPSQITSTKSEPPVIATV